MKNIPNDLKENLKENYAINILEIAKKNKVVMGVSNIYLNFMMDIL